MYLRLLSTECRLILLADMATDTWPIYWPTLGWMSVDMNRQACRPTPGQYFTATQPPLGWYLTNIWPTLRSLGQLLLSNSIFSALLREAFSGCHPFLAFNSGNIHVFFPAMFFPSHCFYIWPSLLSDVATFGDCCFFPSIGHSGICLCESLLFLLSACREVVLHIYSKWWQFELHPRSINTQA